MRLTVTVVSAATAMVLRHHGLAHRPHHDLVRPGVPQLADRHPGRRGSRQHRRHHLGPGRAPDADGESPELGPVHLSLASRARSSHSDRPGRTAADQELTALLHVHQPLGRQARNGPLQHRRACLPVHAGRPGHRRRSGRRDRLQDPPGPLLRQLPARLSLLPHRVSAEPGLGSCPPAAPKPSVRPSTASTTTQPTAASRGRDGSRCRFQDRAASRGTGPPPASSLMTRTRFLPAFLA